MLNEFFDRIETQFDKYSEQKDLYCDGAIFYLNEPKGTLQTWEEDHRLCEFMNFYKSQVGHIRCLILASGFAEFSLFKDDINSNPDYLALIPLFTENEVKQLVDFLTEYADKAGNIDECIELFRQI